MIGRTNRQTNTQGEFFTYINLSGLLPNKNEEQVSGGDFSTLQKDEVEWYLRVRILNSLRVRSLGVDWRRVRYQSWLVRIKF